MNRAVPLPHPHSTVSLRPAGVRSRRALGRRAAAVAASGVLAGCGLPVSTTSQPAHSKEPVTLEYLTTLNARQNENHQALIVDAFAQANAPHKVTIVAGDSTYTKLKTLLAGGTPPDVTWWAYPEAYLAKLIQEVTSYVKRDRYNVGVFSKVLFDDLATWRGRILGLPSQSGGNWPILPYNRQLFAEAGVAEPPARWDDSRWNAQGWLDALQKTTRRGQDGGVASFGMSQIPPGAISLHWAKMWKGAWLSDDFKTITCDSPQMVEAMEYLVGLGGRHQVMATPARLMEAFGSNNAEQAFLTGKVAMYPTFGGGTFAIAQAVKAQNLPLAYAPLPAMKTSYSGQQYDPNGIPVGAKHPEESWALIRWLADTPNWAISRATTPARADHFDAWGKEVYPGIASQVRLDVYRDSLRAAGKIDPLFLLPTFRDMHSTHIVPAINRFYAGATDVAATLQGLKPVLQAMLPTELPS